MLSLQESSSRHKSRLIAAARWLLVPALLVGAAFTAGPAVASTTLGQIGSDPSVAPCAHCSEVQLNSSGLRPSYTVLEGGGVITSWTFRALGAGGTARLRVFRDLPVLLGRTPGELPKARLLAESSDQTFALGETKTTATRIPVSGDGFERLGIAVDGPSGFTHSGDPLDSAADFPYAAPLGTIESTIPFAGFRVAVSATLEPDADHDGYGDETQDQCPTNATTHDACGGAASSPSGGDTTPPLLTVAAPAKESVAKGRLHLFASSSESGSAVVKGRVRMSQLARSYALQRATNAVSAGAQTKLVVRVPKKTLRAIRSALARHRTVRAKLAITVTDAAGNAAAKSVSIRLKR